LRSRWCSGRSVSRYARCIIGLVHDVLQQCQRMQASAMHFCRTITFPAFNRGNVEINDGQQTPETTKTWVHRPDKQPQNADYQTRRFHNPPPFCSIIPAQVRIQAKNIGSAIYAAPDAQTTEFHSRCVKKGASAPTIWVAASGHLNDSFSNVQPSVSLNSW